MWTCTVSPNFSLISSSVKPLVYIHRQKIARGLQYLADQTYLWQRIPQDRNADDAQSNEKKVELPPDI